MEPSLELPSLAKQKSNDTLASKSDIGLEQQQHLDRPLQATLNISSESLGQYSFVTGTTTDPKSPTWRARVGISWEENKGVLLMIVAQFFGSAMAAIARLMETQTSERPPMNPFQILFARQSITVLLSLAYMWWARVPDAPFGPSKLRWLLAARGFGGFFGVTGLYFSLLYLPLSDAIVMTFLAPMLASWVCSILIKTPFTRTQQLAGVVALFGVVLITQPFSLINPVSSDPQGPSNSSVKDGQTSHTVSARSEGSYSDPTPAQRAFAVGCGLIGICGAASAYVTISWIGKRAHPLISVTYFSGWCTFVSVIAMLFVPGVGFRMPATIREWTLLTGLGLTGFVMQFLLTASLAHRRSNRVMNMIYSQMLFALGFDKLLFDEVPTVLSWLGSGLILGSVIWVAVKTGGDKKEDRTADSLQEPGRTTDEEIGLVEGMELEEDQDRPLIRQSTTHPVLEMQNLRS